MDVSQDSTHAAAVDKGWSACTTRLKIQRRKRTQTVTPAVEEAYLRTDVGCGVQGCSLCPPPPVDAASLPAQPRMIALPDGPALAEWLEVWEEPDVADWVVTRSAVEKFATRAGLRQNARLRALYRDKRRALAFFDDVHCAWTASAAQGHKEPQLFVAARFYAHHLQQQQREAQETQGATWQAPPEVIVVSDELAGLTHPTALIDLFRRLLPPVGGDGRESADAPSSLLPVAPLPGASGATEGHQPFTVLPPSEFFLTCFAGRSAAVSDLMDSLLQSKLSKALRVAALDGAGLPLPSSVGSTTGSASAAGSDWQHSRFLTQLELEEGLEDGTLLQGTVIMSQRSAEEPWVRLGGSSANAPGLGDGGADAQLGALARLAGRAALGRALHGDRVAVRLLPPGHNDGSLAVQLPASSGGVSSGAVSSGAVTGASQDEDGGDGDDGEVQLLAQGAEEAGGEEGEGDGAAMVEAVASSGLAGLPCAEVVGVLARDPRTLVASLSPGDDAALRSLGDRTRQRMEAVLVVPYDRRYPLVRVRSRAPRRLLGQRLIIQVDDWPLGSRYPEGHVVRLLGPVNDLKVEGQAVLEQAGIRWQPFCDGAMEELPACPGGDHRQWAPAPEERTTRRDLTGPEYFICSIDPVGCTDVDDAVHVRWLGQGRAELGVHIADVSFFVRPGSLLDSEARDRCTSVYLVDRRLDMLPSRLSEGVASLLGGAERYAVSLLWEVTEQPGSGRLQVAATWAGRTLIRSRHQLHYQQAQDILDGASPAPGDAVPPEDATTLRPALALLKRLADQRRADRLAAGALEFESIEIKFTTDESGGVAAMVPKPKIPMMDVVAELMILSNEEVAHRVSAAFPGSALLRCHPPPKQAALAQLKEVLDAVAGPGRRAGSTEGGLAAELERACRRAARRDAAAATLIKGLAVRAMSQAKYFSTGTAPPGSPGARHYGLALSHYTHFTSPIRRYADVIVHRQLLAALAADGAAGPVVPLQHAQLVPMAARMNEQHRAAKHASARCTELYLLRLLQRRPHIESALITAIHESGRLDVFIPRLQLQAQVHVVRHRRAGRRGGGLVRLPLTGEEEEEAAEEQAGGGGPAQGGPQEAEVDADAALELRNYVYRVEEAAAAIADVRSGQTVWRGALWGRVWIQLSADASGLHGPRLRVRLVSNAHPGARGAGERAAARAATTPDSSTGATSTGTQSGGVAVSPSSPAASRPAAGRRAKDTANAREEWEAEVGEGEEVAAARAAVLITACTPPPAVTRCSIPPVPQPTAVAAARQLAARLARCEAKLAAVRLSARGSRQARRWEARRAELAAQQLPAARCDGV